MAIMTLMVPLIIFSIFLTNFDNLSGNVSSIVAAQSDGWWVMYRHDPQHTSCSTSIAPEINQTLWITQFGDWVRSSPTVHNNIVFIGADDGNFGHLYALNITTGEEIWNYTTGGDVVSSAAVAYSRVYFGSYDNKLYCLDETSGNFLWSFQTGGDVRSSPCVTENKVVFGSDDSKLYCLDAATGSHLWNFSTGGRVESSPAVADGKVFFGSTDANTYALNIPDGSLIWSYPTAAGTIVSPSVVEGKIFIASYKTIYCLNASNADSIWSYTTGGAVYSSPAVAGGNIYIGCKDDKMYCLTAVSGQLKWTFTTGDDVYSSPAIAENKVFFGSNDKKIYCLNATTGACIWSYDTGGEIKTSSPAVANTFVFVASSYYPPFTGKLFAFGRLENTPPIAENLTMTPLSPVTTDNLTGNYDYYDGEGDRESGTEIRWYKNDVLQTEYNDQLEIPLDSTTRDEMWRFTVKPKDGREFGDLQTSSPVTIQNSPPYVDSVMITPDLAYTNDTLLANPNGWFDADDDPEGYTYQWQKWNGTGWQHIQGETSNALSHTYFVKENQIKTTCTPYDGYDLGSPKEDTITISNSPPIIDIHYPATNPTITEGESQEFNITKYDLDEDNLTVAWYLNETELQETSDSYTHTASIGSVGLYNVTVTVSDYSSQTKHEWLLTVLPIYIHDVAITNVTLSKTIVGQGYPMNVNVTTKNQGDLTEAFNVTVYVNTTVVETRDVIVTSGDFATVTFTWNTTGFVRGNYTISAYAWPVQDETNTTDNSFEDGMVLLTISGDVNGDGKVRIDDVLAIALAFGSNYGDPKYDSNLDVTADLKIRIDDVLVAATHFGQG